MWTHKCIFLPELQFLFSFLRCHALIILPLTLFFSSWHTLVHAGSQAKGQNCSVNNNRLDVGTYQFHSDCDTHTYCSSQGICELKGCRKDQYLFGYAPGATLPPKCPSGQFCPDESDACQPWLPVGSACQLNRDGTLRWKFCGSNVVLTPCLLHRSMRATCELAGTGRSLEVRP